MKYPCCIAIALILTCAGPGAGAPESSAAAELRAEGEAMMDAPLRSVMDKTGTAPSGDRHDYFSVLPYWWPNPGTADGLPYINRDGEVNPESRSAQYDRTHYFEMEGAVEKLSWAFAATNNTAFAARCAAHIRNWFLNPDTRMNPNFEWAQCKPGDWEQQPNGIIRGMTLLNILEAVKRIDSSGVWTEADDRAWKDWLKDYVQWLRTSPLADKEKKPSTTTAPAMTSRSPHSPGIAAATPS